MWIKIAYELVGVFVKMASVAVWKAGEVCVVVLIYIFLYLGKNLGQVDKLVAELKFNWVQSIVCL